MWGSKPGQGKLWNVGNTENAAEIHEEILKEAQEERQEREGKEQKRGKEEKEGKREKGNIPGEEKAL